MDSFANVFDSFGTTSTPPIETGQPFDVALFSYLSPLLPYTLYPGHIPQGATLPAFGFIFEQEEPPQYVLGGNAPGFTTVEYEIIIRSTDALECATLQLSLRNRLHGFHNAMMGNTFVYAVRLQNRQGSYEPAISKKDNGTYEITSYYKFSYREPVIAF
jgi:hypothetical protein